MKALLLALLVAMSPARIAAAEEVPGAEPASEGSEAELDAQETTTRALRDLPEDLRLISLLAGLPDSRGGAIAAEELEGRVVVLVVSGRKSRQQARDWGAALAARLTGDGAPLLLPVADLSTVPERLQKAVRKRLGRDPQRLVLDWDGHVRRGHGLEGDGPWLVAGSALSRARTAQPLPPLTPEAADAMLAKVAPGR